MTARWDYSLFTPETLQRIKVLQEKVLNDTITDEELAEGIRLMRQERQAAALAAATSSKKPSAKERAAKINVEDVLANF